MQINDKLLINSISFYEKFIDRSAYFHWYPLSIEEPLADSRVINNDSILQFPMMVIDPAILRPQQYFYVIVLNLDANEWRIPCEFIRLAIACALLRSPVIFHDNKKRSFELIVILYSPKQDFIQAYYPSVVLSAPLFSPNFVLTSEKWEELALFMEQIGHITYTDSEPYGNVVLLWDASQILVFRNLLPSQSHQLPLHSITSQIQKIGPYINLQTILKSGKIPTDAFVIDNLTIDEKIQRFRAQRQFRFEKKRYTPMKDWEIREFHKHIPQDSLLSIDDLSHCPEMIPIFMEFMVRYYHFQVQCCEICENNAVFRYWERPEKPPIYCIVNYSASGISDSLGPLASALLILDHTCKIRIFILDSSIIIREILYSSLKEIIQQNFPNRQTIAQFILNSPMYWAFGWQIQISLNRFWSNPSILNVVQRAMQTDPNSVRFNMITKEYLESSRPPIAANLNSEGPSVDPPEDIPEEE